MKVKLAGYKDIVVKMWEVEVNSPTEYVELEKFLEAAINAYEDWRME